MRVVAKTAWCVAMRCEEKATIQCIYQEQPAGNRCREHAISAGFCTHCGRWVGTGLLTHGYCDNCRAQIGISHGER